jgi:drug/metabolite transporter (DMT)-like permease
VTIPPPAQTVPAEVDSRPESLALGASLLVLAFLANTSQSAFGRALDGAMGAPVFTWLTFVVALVLVLPFLLLRGGRDLATAVLPLHLLRSLTGLAGFFLFITAARLVNLVNANVLLNTTPLCSGARCRPASGAAWGWASPAW